MYDTEQTLRRPPGIKDAGVQACLLAGQSSLMNT